MRIAKYATWNKKWLNPVLILLLLGIWEISYHLGVVDPKRISHPKAVVHVLLNETFLQGFAQMAVQSVCAALIGAALGVLIGRLVIPSVPLTLTVIRLLHAGHWIPFLIFWALPISYPGHSTLLILTISAWTVSAVTVALFTCYHYLTARLLLEQKWIDIKQEVIRGSVLQALFISVISQIWLGPYGWNFFWAGVEYTERQYAAGILLFIILVFVNDLLGYNFEQTSKTRGKIVQRMLAKRDSKSMSQVWLIGLSVVSLWQLLSLSALQPFTSSPLAFLEGAYYLLSTNPYNKSVLWSDIPTSLFEVLCGILLSVSAALVVCTAMYSIQMVKGYILPFLPLSLILPILLPLLLKAWLGNVYIWWTLLGVAAVCFYPCLEIFSGLKDFPFLYRIVAATENALPLAFVAMIFGETINAMAGLGLLMVIGRATYFFPQALGAALITIVLFIMISSTLRFAGRRLFSPTLH